MSASQGVLYEERVATYLGAVCAGLWQCAGVGCGTRQMTILYILFFRFGTELGDPDDFLRV